MVTCQQLRDFYNSHWAKVDGVQVPKLRSQRYNYIALMIQLHYKAESHMTPPVTWCRHSGQMSITEMTVCHAYRECEEEYVNSALAMTQIWGSRQPMATWMSLYISCPLCVSITQFTCCQEQSMTDKGRRLTGETSHYEEEFGTVSLTMGQTKDSVVFSSRWVIFFSVGLLWWIIALLTWFHNAVTRLSVPV